MNLIQLSNDIKNLSDAQLQQHLLQPNGTVPSFLALSEMQRRKDVRNDYAARQQGGNPQMSMAEEYAQGIGGQSNSNYANAVKQGEQGGVPGQPPEGMNDPMQSMGQMGQPMGQAPQMPSQQPQGFALGGAVGPARMYDPNTSNFLPYITKHGAPQPEPVTPGPPPILHPEPTPAPTPAPAPAPPPVAQGLAVLAQSLGGDGGSGNAAGADGGGGSGNGAGGGVGTAAGAAAAAAAAATGEDGTGGGTGSTYRWGGGIRRYADGGVISRNTGNPWNDLFLGGARTIAGQNTDPYVSEQMEAPIPGITGIPGPMEPGYSRGEAMARALQGRSGAIRRDATTPGDAGVMVTPEAFTSGYGQESPGDAGAMVTPMGLRDAYGPNERYGPSAPEGLAAARPPGTPPGSPPPSAPGGGAGGAGGRSGNSAIGTTLADYYGQMQAIKLPDRYAELAKQNAEDKAAVGRDRESSKGEALLTAGLAMAAGRSPNAITNIGEGGLAGVKNWNESTKELRQAARDVRNADQAIAIAQANRDERGLENAMKLKQHAEDLHDRALTRASSSGDAAANRAAMLHLKELELKDTSANRAEIREQHRLDSFRTAATAASREADSLDIAAGKALDQNDPQAQHLKAQADLKRQESLQYGSMYRDSAIEREIRLGNLTRVRTPEEAKKLPKGTRIIRPDGQIGTVN